VTHGGTDGRTAGGARDGRDTPGAEAPDDTPVRVVDCLGRPCPVPVVELARALLAVQPGEVVEVVSDDPAARLDVPAFCRMRGHAFVGEVARPGGTGLRARRAGGAA
jgi:cysteine desulfurase